MPKLRVLLDCDNVLAAIEGDIIRLFTNIRTNSPWTLEEFNKERIPGEWDMTKTLGITHEEFWEKINAKGESFWMDIKPTPWFDDLIRLVEEFTDDWFIASSLPFEPNSYSGRLKWVINLFGEKFDRFIPTSYKYLMANSFTVLVDDKEESCDKFQEAHGHSIVFPSPTNRLYYSAENPLPLVRQGLEYLSNVLSIPKVSVIKKELTNASVLS